MPMQPSPPELIERFGQVLAHFPAAEPRKMFGYPAAFVGGNLATGLFGDGWMARLPAAVLVAALGSGEAHPFQPMPGRAMTGYAMLAPDIVADDARILDWVARAITYTASLPPKK